jgi:hypothetical protein
MRIILTTFTLCALTLPPPVPSLVEAASAQVYPERVRTVTRTVVEKGYVERYQRESSREAVDRSSKTFQIGAAGNIDLGNIAGDIVVTRGSGNEVTIEVIKTARARTDEEAKEALQLVQVSLTERAGHVEGRVRYPNRDEVRRRNWRGINVTVQYTVSAPERARLMLNSVSGAISVRDIKGDIAAETISGDVKIANGGRLSKAKTVSGSVEITDTTLDGAIDSNTISGTMLLRNVKARRLDVGSISGPVVLENVDCERLDAQSMSGGVRFTGPLTPGGRYDIGSHAGEIQITITGNVGFQLDASSFSGRIRSDLDLKGLDPQQANNRRGREISGTYGDGSAFLDVSTFSGSIVIGKK